MKRRELFGATVAGVAVGTSKVMGAPQKKTYVLVHGAWHGGWCWKHVAPLMRAAGADVYVPTLTGLGERAHLAAPEVNLSTHVTDVQKLIEAEELNDVILVGHSYAGHVIPLVADRIKPRLRHVVYLDCVMPTEGKAFLAPEVGAARAKIADRGFLLEIPELAFFGVPQDHPEAPWVKRHLTPHPLPTLTEVVRYASGGDMHLPKTYIRCLQRRDMSVPDPEEPKLRGKADWTWKTIDTRHDAMVTKPKELSEMLLALG